MAYYRRLACACCSSVHSHRFGVGMAWTPIAYHFHNRTLLIGIRTYMTKNSKRIGTAGQVGMQHRNQAVTNKDLLVIALFFHARSHGEAVTPEWVRKHPMWPSNNDQFQKSTAGTAHPGIERLWQAIELEFGLDLRGKPSGGKKAK